MSASALLQRVFPVARAGASRSFVAGRSYQSNFNRTLFVSFRHQREFRNPTLVRNLSSSRAAFAPLSDRNSGSGPNSADSSASSKSTADKGTSKSQGSGDSSTSPSSSSSPEPPSEPQPSPTSLSLDFSPSPKQDKNASIANVSQDQEQQRERTGAKSSKDSLSSIERKRRMVSRSALAMIFFGAIAGVVYMGREWDDGELKERRMTKEIAPSTWWGRVQERFSSVFDYFFKPSWEELLPPPIPPFQKPYTLLLSIDDLLVTSTWDRQHGWRTAKRPGVDYFLGYLSQFYEIVIFTSQHHYTAMPILEKLDPYNFYISYKLFREATRSINGTIAKDLSYLNRDLSKCVMIDTHPDHIALQPENGIIVPKWNGDPNDKGLVGLIPFLESIAIYKPEDVRPILQKYSGKDIAVEYAKQEAENKKKFLEDWEKSGKSKVIKGPTLTGLFGGPSQKKEDSPVPLTYLEQKRKEAQALYLEEQKYLEQNREHFEQLLEEERKAAAAQMSGNLFNVMANLGGPPPVLPPANAIAPPANDSTNSPSTASASTTEPPKLAQQLVSLVANPTDSSSKKQ